MNIHKSSLITTILVTVIAQLVGCSAQTTNKSNCSVWATDLNQKMMAATAPKKLEVLLRGIGRGCGALPTTIQNAAAQAPINIREERTKILGAAAQLSLPEKCKTYSSEEPTAMFAAKCPVGKLKEMSRNTVNAIDIDTYAFIWVVEDSLKKGGVYTEDSQHAVDEIIRNLFMGFVAANELM